MTQGKGPLGEEWGIKYELSTVRESLDTERNPPGDPGYLMLQTAQRRRKQASIREPVLPLPTRERLAFSREQNAQPGQPVYTCLCSRGPVGDPPDLLAQD